MTRGVNCRWRPLVGSIEAVSASGINRRSREPLACDTARPGQRRASIGGDHITTRKSGFPPGGGGPFGLASEAALHGWRRLLG
jgi:hypothetical protein